MKSRLEEDLRIGDLEGLIMDKFQVDSFQPKFCDEKDVAVISFLVTRKESAVQLGDYIAQGPFNFLNVETSSSPDESGSYVVLAELDRSREMFSTIDQLLRYIDQQVHIHDWSFKPYASDKHIPWSKDNFLQFVPQNPSEFQSRNNGGAKAHAPESKTVSEDAGSPQEDSQAEDNDTAAINYSLVARIVEREIAKSSRSYFVEYQKQFKKMTKDTRRLFQHFRQIKTDHQHLIKQLDLHQRREKLALLRERQDVKRIQALEDRLTYLLFAGAEKKKIPAGDSSTPTITIEPAESDTVQNGTADVFEAEIPADSWEASAEKAEAVADGPGESVVEEAEIVQPDDETADLPMFEKKPDETAPKSTETHSEVPLQPSAPDAVEAADDSPVRSLFRQAMDASKNKDYPAAIEKFSEITRLSPDEPRAYYNLAILHFRQADYDSAAQCAQKAIDLGADGAGKILKKITARQSAKSIDKSGSEMRGGAGGDGRDSTDRSQEEMRSAAASALPEDDPLADFSSATVEIGGPPFTATEAAQSETVGETAVKTDLHTADTEAIKEEELTPFAVPEGEDPVAVDPEAKAEEKEPVEPGPAGDTGEKTDSAVAALSSSEQIEPETDEYVSPIEEMPTIDLNMFIDEPASSPSPTEEQGLEEESVVDEVPVADVLEEKTAAADAAADIEEEPAASAEQPAAAGLQPGVDSEAEAEPDEQAPVSPPPEKTDPDAAEQRLAAAMEPEEPETPAAEPSKEDGAESDKAPEIVDMDLFARGVAATKKKNYAEALQFIAKFVELNPNHPRGYYNLAILNYRLKDFEAARDMARKALDMGVGSAQKVYEKSQIRVAKQRNVALDSSETASTDTIFEELETTSFDTVDPQLLEKVTDTESKQSAPPQVPVAGSLPPAAKETGAAGSSDVAVNDPEKPTVEAEIGKKESIPEFPVLTGDIVKEGDAAKKAVDSQEQATGEQLPEIEAVPLAEPAAEQSSPPSVEDSSETAAPPLPSPEVTEPMAAKLTEAVTSQPTPSPLPVDEEKKGPSQAPPDESKPEKAPMTAEKGAEELFSEGMQAYRQKNFDHAIDIFNQFIALRPKEPRGYYNLAIVCYRKKDYRTAHKNAAKAYKLGAKAAKKILLKIKRKQQKAAQSKPDAAIADGKRRKKRKKARKPSSTAAQPKAATETADTAQPGGGAAKALATLEPPKAGAGHGAVDDISDYDTATFDIAEVLGHDPVVWDADDMEEEVDTSEIHSPLLGEGNNDDVIVFESNASDESHKSEAVSASSVASDTVDAKTNRKKSPKAPDKRAGSKDRDGSDGAGSDMFSLGMAASEKKEYLKAIRYFKKFTEISPKDPRGFYNLAVVSYRLKSYETAREHAKRALDLGAKPAAKILSKIKAKTVAA